MCQHPLFNKSVGSLLYVLDFNESAVSTVGTTVSFICLVPGQVHTGPSTATCMENGQWEPDPDELQKNCEGLDISNPGNNAVILSILDYPIVYSVMKIDGSACNIQCRPALALILCGINK